MVKYAGGCLCGAVRYEINGTPTWSAHCHCRSCQRALGAAFASWSRVAAEDFNVTKGAITYCETSPGVTRGFCGQCGTSLNYRSAGEVEGQDWAADAWFATASLDDPSIAKPKSHVYVSHKLPFIQMNDGLPTFEEF